MCSSDLLRISRRTRLLATSRPTRHSRHFRRRNRRTRLSGCTPPHFRLCSSDNTSSSLSARSNHFIHRTHRPLLRQRQLSLLETGSFRLLLRSRQRPKAVSPKFSLSTRLHLSRCRRIRTRTQGRQILTANLTLQLWAPAKRTKFLLSLRRSPVLVPEPGPEKKKPTS